MRAAHIHHLFDDWLQRSPERTFLRRSEGPMNFAALGQLVAQLEAELREDGVRGGDRVLIVAEVQRNILARQVLELPA